MRPAVYARVSTLDRIRDRVLAGLQRARATEGSRQGRRPPDGRWAAGCSCVLRRLSSSISTFRKSVLTMNVLPRSENGERP